MFTDIIGYNKLMHEDEDLAIQIVDKYKRTLESSIELFNGEILQYYGDGSVAVFDNAVESVRCAIHLQIALTSAGVPIRLGLHLGDIIRENDEAYGDGINIASRIESMGKKFSVLLSKVIQKVISNHTEFKLKSLGEFTFKNISEPIEVFAVENKGLVVPQRHELQGRFSTSSVPKKSKNIKKF